MSGESPEAATAVPIRIQGERRLLAVTGEPSGEQHLAGVIQALERLHPGVGWRWRGSGGPRMAEAGAEVIFQVSRLSAIGPRAAAARLPEYIELRRRILRECRENRPDLAVLVDFPDFNLRLVRPLKALGIPVCYFIGPQLWAWRPSRIETIRRFVDLMLVIFPFEEEYYRDRGVRAVFVGNPSARTLRDRVRRTNQGSGDPVRVALMPGSRRKEVELILPVMLDAAVEMNRKRSCCFWILQAAGMRREYLDEQLELWRRGSAVDLPVELKDGTEDWLGQADCAMVKSGTSTLEALLLEVPFAMVYRMSGLSYRLLRPFVKIETYCLANLVAGERIVPEFVQDEARGAAIADFLLQLLNDPRRLEEMRLKMRRASELLGSRDAYRAAAEEIAGLLEGKKLS